MNAASAAVRRSGRRVSARHVLRFGVSHAVLAMVVGTSQSAQAASYTASNQAELVGAIAAANSDGDPSSTITLTGSFAIPDPSTIPSITKALTIDAAGFNVTTPGNVSYTVASGVSLVLKGDIDGSGFLAKGGAGTLVITGTGNQYARVLNVLEGAVRIENGGQVFAGNPTDGGLYLSGDHTSLVVNGTGSKFAANGGVRVGSAQGNSLLVEAGGALTGPGVSIATSKSEIGTLTVRGAGSTVTTTSQVAVFQGTGYINILDGGVVTSASGGLGGGGVNLPSGGTGTAVISGAGSRWTTGAFGVHDGSLSVLDGGRMEVTYLRAGVNATSGGRALQGHILVSGAGSALVATSAVQTTIIGDGGTVTLADGNGTLYVASKAAGKGTINIGGATGAAATAAGNLNVAKVQFGAGTGVVNFNHTNQSYNFSPAMLGAGSVNQIGPGRTVLTGANTYTGATTVSGGTLAAGGLATLSSASAYQVGAAGTLDLAGFSHTLASLENGGTVRLGGGANTTLTTTGNYVGDGGTLVISAVLGDDSSATDLLHVVGDTSGTTGIRVVNVGGMGAETTGNGIKIVQVDGASAADAFALSGPAIGGAYRYDLFQNDLLGTQDDGDWYLRADGLAPTLPTYESYPAVMLGLISLPTLQQRVGDRRPDRTNEAGDTALWTRIEGAHARVKADGSTTEASYDSDLFQLQVGFDGEVMEAASGALVAGITAQYSRASADVSSDLGNGSNTTEGYGIGASLTWYGQNGVYVDGQAQVAWFDTDLSADGVGKLADGNNGTGYALSVELGREFAVKQGWTVTPQAQLAYASADFDDFVDPYGAAVSLSKGESLEGRVGVALGRDASWQDDAGRKARSYIYGITSLTYEFLDGATVAVSGVDLVAEPQKFGAELGLGGTYNWGDERYALHGEALASTSFDGSYGYKGTVGLTVGF